MMIQALLLLAFCYIDDGAALALRHRSGDPGAAGDAAYAEAAATATEAVQPNGEIELSDTQEGREQPLEPIISGNNDEAEGGVAESVFGSLVFSDVDDTITCSGIEGGVRAKVSGVDRSCYNGEVYPGAPQFMLELTRSSFHLRHDTQLWERVDDEGMATRKKLPNAIPLSARPKQMGISPESTMVAEYEEAGRVNGVDWGLNLDRALYGSVIAGVVSMAVGYAPMGNNKLDGWLQFDSPLPSSFFIGDDGQGDVIGAQGMLQATYSGSMQHPLRMAFIHHVEHFYDKAVPDMALADVRAAAEGVERVDQQAASELVRFSNYADASVRAYKLGLIDKSAVARVLAAVHASSVAQICRLRDVLSNNYPCIVDDDSNAPALSVCLDSQDAELTSVRTATFARLYQSPQGRGKGRMDKLADATVALPRCSTQCRSLSTCRGQPTARTFFGLRQSTPAPWCAEHEPDWHTPYRCDKLAAFFDVRTTTVGQAVGSAHPAVRQLKLELWAVPHGFGN